MIICTKCKKEMRCKKNGVIATWHNTHRYAGDLFACSCGAEILNTNSTPYHSEDKIDEKYHLLMEE